MGALALDELADKSTTGRLSKLKGKLAIPGWIALIWRLLWKPVGWLGNLDVMREHWNWIMKLAAALSNSGVVYALFTIGIVWLVIVVFYGDKLAQKFRPWKVILVVAGSMTVISIFAASAVKVPLPSASTQTIPAQRNATPAPPETAPLASGNPQRKADDQAKGPKKLKIKKPQQEPKAEVPQSSAVQSPGTTTEINKVIDNADVTAQQHQPKDTVTANVNASPSVPAQQPTFSVTNPSGSIINQGSTVDAPQTVNNLGPPPPVFTLKLLRENVKLGENRYLTDYQLNVKGNTIPSLHVRAEGLGLGFGDIPACLMVVRVTAGGGTGNSRDSTSGYGFCETHAQNLRSGQYLIEVVSATPTTVHLTYEPD